MINNHMDQRVLIIIPAHNEEASIVDVIVGLRNSTPDFDRVVINDGSTDATEEVVDSLGEKQLKLVCNLGYGQALQTGLKYALLCGYDIVVCMDADGQHRPEDVPRLVNAMLESDADMVIGSRFCAGEPYKTPVSRRLGQLMFSHLTQLLLDHRIYDTSSGFKALRIATSKVIMEGAFMDFHMETIVLLSLFNHKIIEVPVTVRERVHGHSMHSITSIFHYPIRTLLLTLAAILEAHMIRRAQ